MGVKTVCVDFDGVIHEYKGWNGFLPTGEPIPGAREFLANLAARYQVVIHTSRKPEYVWPWLTRYAMTDMVYEVTNTKVPAIAYVDDRAVRFDGDFDKALREISSPAHWEE